MPGCRILYVDDDPSLRRLIEKALVRAGFDVSLAAGGDEGLAALDAVAFDAIALDHHMPGKDGLATLAEIRSRADPPPVVYVTGTDEGRVAVAALKAGAADYIVKDVGGAFLELLPTVIEQAIAQAALFRAREAAEAEVRAARDRAELLLREVNHRVANSLALVASLVRLQANAAEEAREVLIATERRIHAIAGVHRRLYTSNDVAEVDLQAYLGSMAEELGDTLGGCALALELVPLKVATDKAVSLGVIVNELVTNAAKYAYPACKGEIRVGLTRDGDHATLTVEDDGVGLSGGTQGTGLGTRVVKAMAAGLRSEPVTDADHDGARVTIRFPL
jgi:two-component sensor histidine kinase